MNNFETADKIHNIAMEFSDLAKIAQLRGQNDTHQAYLKRAFTLEKEAAFMLQLEPEENYWKYIFLKSAGWLAWQLEQYDEALQLAELGLSGTATGLPLYKLEELKATVTKKILEQQQQPHILNTTKEHFYGLLASADFEQEQIKFKEQGAQKYRTLNASKALIQQTVRYLIGEYVEIDAQAGENGELILQRIRKVAA